MYALRFVQGNLLIGLSNSTLTHWNIQTRENCGYFANKSQHVHGMAIHPSGNDMPSALGTIAFWCWTLAMATPCQTYMLMEQGAARLCTLLMAVSSQPVHGMA